MSPRMTNRTQPLNGVTPSFLTLLHCCWTTYLLPFSTTLLPSDCRDPNRKLHLSEISPEKSESNQAGGLNRGSVVDSKCSCAAREISASAATLPFGDCVIPTQPAGQLLAKGMFE